MTRHDRNLFFRIGGLGLVITLLIIAAVRVGMLEPLENYLYDLRARKCQIYTKAPSDRIFHVDIDDQSVNEIGRWPWPRSVEAKLIDEMRLAEAKVVAL